ncbi:MAG: sensor histidine kinase [Ktedonobacteraceae bacterium]|nr:sensor histidine kinase [Chloroflexota bacterium]
MQQKTMQQVESMQVGLALQLVVSFLLAGGIALGVASLADSIGIQQPVVSILAMVVAGVAGLLLTLNIQYSLYLAHLALARLVGGSPVEEDGALRWRWPLTPLFAQLHVLKQHTRELLQRERLGSEYRDQLLRQASEAAAQEERNRLARDLHDSIKQQLFGISMRVAAAQARTEDGPGEAGVVLADIQRSAQEAQVEMQALLQQLRPAPLENVGLVEALRIQAQALGYRTDAQVSVELSALPPEERLPPGTQEMVFRIVQEAFSNIARHARAHHVWLSLYTWDEALHVEVRDDGQGFEVATSQSGMGLPNMRERAASLGGTIDMQTTSGAGTILHLHIPFVAPLVKQENAVVEAEITTSMEQAGKYLQFGLEAAGLAGALILLDIPFVAIGLALVVALCMYIQARRYSTRVVLAAGSTNVQRFSLRYREHELLFSILALSCLCIWYLPSVQHTWPVRLNIWALLALSLALAGFALIELVQSYRVLERYYAVSAWSELVNEMVQRRNGVKRSAQFWLLVVVLSFFFGPLTLAFPPLTLAQWVSDAQLAILICWPLLNLVEYIQTVHWQSMPVRNGEDRHGAHNG